MLPYPKSGTAEPGIGRTESLGDRIEAGARSHPDRYS